MEICSDILKETTKCTHNFICLNNPQENICCKVKDCINSKVHFVESTTNNTCPYIMSFGYAYICNCPVRKEIFNKYGV